MSGFRFDIDASGAIKNSSQLKKALNELGKQGIVTEKDINSLTEAAKKGFEADQASKKAEKLATTIDQIGKACGLTSKKLNEMRSKAGVATTSMQSLGRQKEVFTKMGDGASSLVKKIAAVSAAYIGLRAIAGGISSSFGAFTSYESSLTDMAKVTKQDLGEINKQIMAMPSSLGGPTELVKGYYQTISAGVTDSSAAMDLLTTAAKASKAAHVSQEDEIKALTKTMAGFDGELRSATEASDLLFKIERVGQTSVGELVPVIGDIAAVTHMVGVKSQEMAAGLGLITQTSGTTAEAATKWKAIMIGLYKPTENMSKVLKALGYSSGESMVKTLGFARTLQTLQAVATKSGFSLGKLFESSEALTGITALSASKWDRFATVLNDVKSGSNETESAFKRLSSTSGDALEEFSAVLEKVEISIGKVFAPEITSAIKDFQDQISRPEGAAAIESLANGIANLSKNLLSNAIPALTSFVNKINDIVDAWNKIPAPLQGAIIGGGVGALVSKGNPWITGLSAFGGMVEFGDSYNKQEVAKGMAISMARKKREDQTQAILSGNNTGTIPELRTMFPDLAPQVQTAKKSIDAINVSLEANKKHSQNAANAAARYGERTSSALEQAKDQYDQLLAQYNGDSLGAQLAAIEKKYARMASSIKQSMIGAKGSTEKLKETLNLLGKSKAMEILIAQTDAWKRSMQEAAAMLSKLGELSGDPKAIYAGRMASSQVWDAEQQNKINAINDPDERSKRQAELDRVKILEERDARIQAYESVQAMSSTYWMAERERIQDHLDVVKKSATDETAYKIYAAQKWDAYNKAILEKQAVYADSFAKTFKAKWKLAFGSYKSGTTQAHEQWENFSDALISLTQGSISSVSGGFSDFFQKVAKETATASDLWEAMCDRMLDAVANFIDQMISQQLTRLAAALGNSSLGNIISSFFGGSSSSSSGINTSFDWSGAITSTPFANGGVFRSGTSLPVNTIIDTPTFFSTSDHDFHAYANGGVLNNVVGEAGYPEGIFPLTSVGGKLGVMGKMDTSGSAQQANQNITFNIQNNTGQNIAMSKAKTTQNQDGIVVTMLLDLVNRNVGGLRTGMQAAMGVR